MSQSRKPTDSKRRQTGTPDEGTYYERHLPHQVPSGLPIFLNWNLKGSLPKRVVAELQQQRRRLETQPHRRGETGRHRKVRQEKLMFAKRDRYLDAAREGPLHLQDPRAAKIMVDSILWGVGERYTLYAYVVMANHVHRLLTPAVDLEVVTQGMKGYTSYRINAIQQARGRVLWQDESYDHWARTRRRCNASLTTSRTTRWPPACARDPRIGPGRRPRGGEDCVGNLPRPFGLNGSRS